MSGSRRCRDRPSASGGSPRRFDSRQVSTAVAAILLAWFAIANWQRVEIHF